ncbi:MAG TPA: hypothetical protein VJ300_06445 [Thermoplasmata archaeon]|nr:hypothetical protein [Thermoplasmata archaeon]
MPSAMPSARSVSEALRRAERLLRACGYSSHATTKDFVAWLQTDTPYPNPTPHALLENPFLVVHEIVEIEEVKRRGLRITRDVIVRNLKAVDIAHARAAEVELEVAKVHGAFDHLRERLEDVRGWSLDPVVTPAQKKRYRSLYRKTKAALDGLARASGEP